MGGKYKKVYTSQFKKDLKNAIKQNRDKDSLDDIINLLSNGKKLPDKYKDHALKGAYRGARECHIEPNWLLIYAINKGRLILTLMRTGSHSELF
jgi:mRNA interferase YafQ